MRRLIPAVLVGLALVATLAASRAAAVPSTGSRAASPAAVASIFPVPPAPRVTSGIEAAAAYVPAVSCDGVLKPGTGSLASLLTTTYAGTSAGTVRACASDGATSEHYDGRAVDWMTTVRTADGLARGDTLVGWLLATDAQGNAFANARRLGVMYIIWNGKIWGAYRHSDGWRPYSSCATHPETSWDTACHRDHVHLSLSWEGAMRRTSYWTGTVANADYGPCRVPDLSWAPPYTAARSTGCPSVPMPVAPTGASTLTKALVAISGMVLRPGSSGTPVATVNERFGVGGSSWTASTSSAVQAYQTSARVPVTGVLDVTTWRALLGTTAPNTSPRGVVDTVTAGYRSLTVRGWAFDPESTGSIQVRVTVDGAATLAVADRSRPDVGAAFPGAGDAHGYGVTVAAGPGTRQVCVTAVNIGAGQDTALGCRAVAVSGALVGHLDGANATSSGLTVSGWAMDPDTTGAATVRLLVDGVVVGSTSASRPRPDVARVYPGVPAATGFVAAVPTEPGAHTVCAVGVNVGTGSDVTLGCAEVQVIGRVAMSTATLGTPLGR